MPMIPYVIQTSNNRERISDIYSCLLEERIVFITEEITDALASLVVAQLLYLESQAPDKDIYVYIHSPGGSVSAGMAIYDTMQYIKCDVSTICMGIAASMASVLLLAGTKGKRYCLPNAEVMLHQPLGGAHGQASDVKIAAEHILDIRKRLNQILSAKTGKTCEQIALDTERDHWLSSYDACEYGIVDKVIENKK